MNEEVTDPVCGLQFPEDAAEELGALKVVHKGKAHWFCSPTCEREFRAAPDKFV